MKTIKCIECGIEILIGMNYMKHENGTILCDNCFKKLVDSGEIK